MTVLLPSMPVLLGFGAASLMTLVVPGPSVAYVVARSVTHGRRAGLYSVLGLETGAMLHVLAATVGLAALLTSSPAAFGAVRWAGAGYLVWLAVREFRTAHPALRDRCDDPPAYRPLQIYRDGVLVDLLNPKTAIFFLAFLPQFVDPSRGGTTAQLAVLGVAFVALATLVDSTYAVLAGRASARFRESAGARRRLSVVTGGVYLTLAGVAVVA